MPTSPLVNWNGTRVSPVMNHESANSSPVMLKESIVYPAGTLLGEMIGTDEEQTITIDAAGGTFTVTYAAQTTSAIAWNASAATFQAAMEALSTIGAGNLLAWKPSALVFRFAFRGALGSTNVAAVTTTATGLTGGAGTAVVATAVAGVAGTQGKFNAYASGNTDGSQVPKCVLEYPCATDASGNITVGDVAGNSEWSQTQKSAPAWFNGIFRTEDVIGLDANAISVMNARLLNGTIYHGRLAIPA